MKTFFFLKFHCVPAFPRDNKERHLALCIGQHFIWTVAAKMLVQLILTKVRETQGGSKSQQDCQNWGYLDYQVLLVSCQSPANLWRFTFQR